MATQTVITPNDFHEDDFQIVDNKIRSGSRNKPTGVFEVELRNGASVFATGDQVYRKRLVVERGIGFLHLDIKLSSASGAQKQIGWLPDDCPVPEGVIEAQHIDGGTVWLSPNQRGVYASGMSANKRYIVDLVGTFIYNS